MYAGGQGGSIKWFEFEYELPQGIYGDQVMLQWKYITANSVRNPMRCFFGKVFYYFNVGPHFSSRKNPALQLIR